MVGFAYALGVLGALSVVAGVLRATEVIPVIGTSIDWMFWLILSIVFFVSCIAVTVVIRQSGE